MIPRVDWDAHVQREGLGSIYRLPDAGLKVWQRGKNAESGPDRALRRVFVCLGIPEIR